MATASDIPPKISPDSSQHISDDLDDSVNSSDGKYDHSAIEPRVRELWNESDVYRWDPEDTDRPKWFVQSMFPYPSGDLHIGHWFAFSGGDAAARFKRMEGYNVLHPPRLRRLRPTR